MTEEMNSAVSSRTHGPASGAHAGPSFPDKRLLPLRSLSSERKQGKAGPRLPGYCAFPQGVTAPVEQLAQ